MARYENLLKKDPSLWTEDDRLFMQLREHRSNVIPTEEERKTLNRLGLLQRPGGVKSASLATQLSWPLTTNFGKVREAYRGEMSRVRYFSGGGTDPGEPEVQRMRQGYAEHLDLIEKFYPGALNYDVERKKRANILESAESFRPLFDISPTLLRRYGGRFVWEAMRSISSGKMGYGTATDLGIPALQDIMSRVDDPSVRTSLQQDIERMGDIRSFTDSDLSPDEAWKQSPEYQEYRRATTTESNDQLAYEYFQNKFARTYYKDFEMQTPFSNLQRYLPNYNWNTPWNIAQERGLGSISTPQTQPLDFGNLLRTSRITGGLQDMQPQQQVSRQQQITSSLVGPSSGGGIFNVPSRGQTQNVGVLGPQGYGQQGQATPWFQSSNYFNL